MRRSPAALLIFVALKYAMGLRVSEEERMGLDLGEHGMEAYAGFQLGHSVRPPVDGSRSCRGAGARVEGEPGDRAVRVAARCYR